MLNIVFSRLWVYLDAELPAGWRQVDHRQNWQSSEKYFQGQDTIFIEHTVSCAKFCDYFADRE